MATVHTAYGPGTIVDRETVRGRTQYKVAGDGFEVWLDETKLAGYSPPAEGVDESAPHWHGHELGDGLSEDAFGDFTPPTEDMLAEYEEYADPRGLRHRDRMQTHEDYEGWGDSDVAHYSSLRQAWAPFDQDNSTTLPYNPDPQHNSLDGPGYDDGSATIQPIHHIDADERLSPADSVTFDSEDDDDSPDPNPDLFAKQAVVENVLVNSPRVRRVIKKVLPGHETDKMLDQGSGYLTGHGMGLGANFVGRQVNEAINYVSPGPGWGNLIKPASLHEANPAAALLPAVLRAVGPSLVGGALGGGSDEGGEGEYGPGPGWGDLVKDAHSRPAGLSDKYIDLTASVDYWNDPVAQFRHDPDAYINRIGQVMDEGLNPRFAEYMDLVEGDNSIRTAAWKDVRKKAMRLKREGHVTVKDIAPNRIMASVVGDHGTYDVVILKSGSYGGLSEGNPGHAISNWHCGCEWGKWAFRRKYTYVGRLCSHAYASYLTMQSEHMKGKPRQQKGPKRKAPSRSLPFLHVKRGRLVEADNLQNGPKRLTPDMVVNDTDDAHMFLDVTEDERKDTGPDDVVSDKDIVHFARLMRHCEVTESPYPRELVAFLSRYAGCNDDSSDDTQADYKAHDADDADPYLEKIRSDADRKQEEDFGDMADRVHRMQDAVEEARAHGVDADRFVAMVKRADPISDAYDRVYDPATGRDKVKSTGKPAPVETFRDWAGLNSVYDPETRRDKPKPGTEDAAVTTTGAPRGNRQESTDSGGKTTTTETTPSSAADNIKADNEDDFRDSGSKLPADRTVNNPPMPSSKGDNRPKAPEGQQRVPGGQQPGSPEVGSGQGGSGGYTAPGGGQTTGPVADGGVAGAENGNNAAITKGLLDADGNYTVQAGDTLTDIAQRTTGDMNKYQDIAKANSGITNVDNLEVGTKINLKDFANDVGNNNVRGDLTNPAGGGGDRNLSTPNVDVNAVGSSSYASGKQDAVNTEAVTPPATPPATTGDANANAANITLTNKGGETQSVTDPGLTSPATPAKVSAKWWLNKFAAPGDASQQQQTDTQTGESANNTAPTTSPQSAGGARANAGNATNPATPATPATPGATNTLPKVGPNQDQEQQPSTVGPDKEGDTYDPNQVGMGQNRNDGTQQSFGGGMNGGDILGAGLDAASGVASGVGEVLPDLASGAMQAAPDIASGVGDAISGIASGIGSIFASRQDFDDWVRYAYPTADGEGDLDPHTHPFAGSGYPGPLEFGTSEEYADKARKKMDDVTDLGDDPLSTPMGKWQRQSSHETVYPVRAVNGDGSFDDCPAVSQDEPRPHEILPNGECIHCYDKPFDDDEEGAFREASFEGGTDDNSDIVRAFQAGLADSALGAGAGGGGGRFDDIAGAAAGFLRTAGRNYSLSEQSELIREGDKGGARNLDSLDLTGTHYEDMHTLGW